MMQARLCNKLSAFFALRESVVVNSNSCPHFRKCPINRNLIIEVGTPMGSNHKVEEIKLRPLP